MLFQTFAHVYIVYNICCTIHDIGLWYIYICIYIYIVYNVTWSLSYFFQPFLGWTYFRSGVVSAGSSQQWFFGEDLPIWCFIIMEIPWKFMDLADLSSFSLWTFPSLWFLKLQPEPLCWQKRCKNDQNIAIFLMYPVFRQTPKKYNEGTPGIIMKQTVRWLKKISPMFFGVKCTAFFSLECRIMVIKTGIEHINHNDIGVWQNYINPWIHQKPDLFVQQAQPKRGEKYQVQHEQVVWSAGDELGPPIPRSFSYNWLKGTHCWFQPLVLGICSVFCFFSQHNHSMDHALAVLWSWLRM